MTDKFVICWRDYRGNEHRGRQPMEHKAAEKEMNKLQNADGALRTYWLEVAPDEQRSEWPQEWGK